MTGSIKPFD